MSTIDLDFVECEVVIGKLLDQHTKVVTLGSYDVVQSVNLCLKARGG